MTNIVELPKDTSNRDSMIALLERQLAQVRSGQITRIGVVFEINGTQWGTEFAASDDRRMDAAMLMELAMRRLGFETASDDGK